MTITPCPNCGSTRNSAASRTCVTCGKSLPGSSGFPTAATASLVIAGGRRYNLSTSTPTLIGSRGCAILLSAPGVAAQHARLLPTGGGFMIEPVMGTVFLNGSTISTAAPLPPGSKISLGSLTLTYSGPACTAPPPKTIIPSAPAITPVKTSPPPSAITKPKSSWLSIQPRTPQLEGHILVSDGPHPEEPDIDWAGLVLRGTFGLILLPFLCWQPALLMPFFLYGMANRNRQTPTRYLRVEDRTGKQFIVKMKGDPLRGMLSQGDDASFWGRWVGGNLVMDRAHNQNTNSDVLLKPAIQRKTNQIILAILVGLYLVFWITASLGAY